jgi:5'-3' exonuclease
VSPRECVDVLHSFLAQVSGTPSHSWPIVFVFDGPIADEKKQTRLGRTADKISKADKLLESWTGSSSQQHANKRARKTFSPNHQVYLIPPLAITACIQALFEAGHEVYVAEQEADLDIVVLARERNSLILSNDSDFFILHSPGYMPLKSIPFGREGPLSGRVYNVESVRANLGIAEDLLPLLAPLAGCDSFPGLATYDIRSGVRLLQGESGTLDEVLSTISKGDRELLETLRDAATPYFAPEPLPPGSSAPTNPLVLPKYTPGPSHPILQELIQNGTFWCAPFVEDNRCGRLSYYLFHRMIT